MERNQESLIRPVMPELDTVRGLAILLVLFFHGFGFQFASAPLPLLAHLFVDRNHARMGRSQFIFRSLWILNYRHFARQQKSSSLLQEILRSPGASHTPGLLCISSAFGGCPQNGLVRSSPSLMAICWLEFPLSVECDNSICCANAIWRVVVSRGGRTLLLGLAACRTCNFSRKSLAICALSRRLHLSSSSRNCLRWGDQYGSRLHVAGGRWIGHWFVAGIVQPWLVV